MSRILMLDNYDSFTYNLVHYLEGLGTVVTVRRNDGIDLEEVAAYDKIVLSPGPGLPGEAGLLNEVIRRYGSRKSLLGICLGMQAIAEVYGGRLQNLKEVHHGVSHPVSVLDATEILFRGLAPSQQVGRYHSWTVATPLPDCLEATAVDEQGRIMALRHKEFDLRGLQFHPESVLTPNGRQMLANWVTGGFVL